MAVALAEPQVPIYESTPARRDIKKARESIKFKPDLRTEEQRTQFVEDFHTIAFSSEATDRDKENFTQAFRSQDRISKLYIGQILLEKLEDNVRGGENERSIRAFLDVAKLIKLSQECSLDKKEKKDVDALLKELNKIYTDKAGAKLSPLQRGVLAVGAAGTMLGIADTNTRQASREAAQQNAPITTPDTRSTPPGFDINIDWGDQDGGLRIPTPSITPRAPEPPKEKTITQQEDEKLIPHSIRALQNPEFNKLYKEGCLDTKETIINGLKVIVVDFVKKPGVTCDLKFPQVYEAHPVQGRLQTYKQSGETQIRVSQVDVTCAIHSFTMAALIARSRANPGETPTVVNPLLMGEADTTLTPELYNQLQQDLLNDPTFRSRYGIDTMTQFARSSVINNATQRTDVTERVFRSVYGAEVNRGIMIEHPKIGPDGRISFKQSSFSEAEWQALGQKYNFSIEGDQVFTNKETANRIFGVWLEKWYKDLNDKAEQDNKSAVPVFNIRYYAEGINHAYVVFGIKEIDGRKYFQLTEGLGGQISAYLADQGAKAGENGTVLVSLDNMWNTGLLEAYSFTVDKPAPLATMPGEHTLSILQAQSSRPIEASRSQERRETPTSSQFGFRVNSVEAIQKLPSSIGMIRIAGNDTALNPDGTIMNQENVYFFEDMLNAADKKGLKVVFVYNPQWFPGTTNRTLTEADIQTTRVIIEQQMRAILKHPSVSHIEVGNEVDENKPNSTVQFWKGSLTDYAKFFKITSDIIQVINKTNGTNTEVVLSAFGDPTGVHNPSEKNYAELSEALRDNGVEMSKLLVAGHAYHLDQLQWIIENLPKIFGTQRPPIITEMNVGRGDRPAYQQDFDAMIKLIEKSKGVQALIHEWKPEMPDDIDYGGGHLALNETDPRTKIIMTTIARELNQRQLIALSPRNAN